MTFSSITPRFTGAGPGAGSPSSRAATVRGRGLLAGALCAAGLAAGGLPHGTLTLFLTEGRAA